MRQRRWSKICWMGMFLSVGAMPLLAWPFGSSSKGDAPGRREREVKSPEPKHAERVVKVLTPAEAERLVRLNQMRRERQDELTILGRLSGEKQSELESFNVKLSKEYGIDDQRVYTYDATNRTVYLLLPSEGQPAAAGGTVAAKGGVQTNAVAVAAAARRLPHRVFPTAEESQAFAQLVVAKKLTQQQLDVFATVEREKRLELAQVQGLLKKELGIDPQRNYRFEEETRKLYERMDGRSADASAATAAGLPAAVPPVRTSAGDGSRVSAPPRGSALRTPAPSNLPPKR